MDRAQLEHLVRAAAAITGEDELVVVGSQAILGERPDAPPGLRSSMGADMDPRRRPDLWTLIDGSIGELSPFHTTFGYYAQGAGPETAILAMGWEERLVAVFNENKFPVRLAGLEHAVEANRQDAKGPRGQGRKRHGRTRFGGRQSGTPPGPHSNFRSTLRKDGSERIVRTNGSCGLGVLASWRLNLRKNAPSAELRSSGTNRLIDAPLPLPGRSRHLATRDSVFAEYGVKMIQA